MQFGLTHYFRVARQNEAARRRTLRVRRTEQCCLVVEISFGSQGGPCDPSTKNHAGGTPATSLLTGYHTTLYPHGRKIRTALPLLSRSPGPAAYSLAKKLDELCPGFRPTRTRACMRFAPHLSDRGRGVHPREEAVEKLFARLGNLERPEGRVECKSAKSGSVGDVLRLRFS